MKKILIICLFFLPALSSSKDSNWMFWNNKNSPMTYSKVFIAIDSAGYKWITTTHELFKTDTYTWSKFDTSNTKIPYCELGGILIDKNNNKWIPAWLSDLRVNVIFVFSDTGCKILSYQDIGFDNSFMDLTMDRNNNIWVFQQNHIGKFDGSSWSIFDTSVIGASNGRIISAAQDSNGSMWFGTYYDLIKYDGTNWTKYNKKNTGMPLNGIMSIYIDSKGVKYFGSGLYLIKYDDANWVKYDSTNSPLPWACDIRHITKDKKDILWFSTNQLGLWKYDGTNWTLFDLIDNKYDLKTITSIVVDKYNNKWITNQRYLAVYNEDGIVGVNAIEEQPEPTTTDGIVIYPNPSYSGHEITLQIPENISGIKISLYNSLGSLLDTHIESDVSPGQRTINYKPNVELSSGNYWLRVETGRESWCKPFLIIKN